MGTYGIKDWEYRGKKLRKKGKERKQTTVTRTVLHGWIITMFHQPRLWSTHTYNPLYNWSVSIKKRGENEDCISLNDHSGE